MADQVGNTGRKNEQALDFFNEVYALGDRQAIGREITSPADLFELGELLGGVDSMQRNEAELHWEHLFRREIPDHFLASSSSVVNRLDGARAYPQGARSMTHILFGRRDGIWKEVPLSQRPLLRAATLREIASKAASMGFFNYGPESGDRIFQNPVPGYIDFVPITTSIPKPADHQGIRYATRALFTGAMNVMPSGQDAEVAHTFNYPSQHELHFDTRFLQRSLADTLMYELGEDYAELSREEVQSVVEEVATHITDSNVVIDPEQYQALLEEIQERLEGKKPGQASGMHQARWGKAFTREASLNNLSLIKENTTNLVDGSLSTECSIYADGYEIIAYTYIGNEIDDISIYELPEGLDAASAVFTLGCVDTCMNAEGTYTYQSNLEVAGVDLETGASYANCQVTACDFSWIVNGHSSSYFEENTVRISGTYELADHTGALHTVDFDYILSEGLSDCSNYVGQITFDGIFYDASQVCQIGLSSIESGNGCGSP